MATLLVVIRKEGSMQKWGVKPQVDMSVCRREIVWMVSKIPYKVGSKEMVVRRLKEQLEAVNLSLVRKVWPTNGASFPVYVKGVERLPRFIGDGIVDETIKREN